MATADKTSRRTKNIFSPENIKKARDGKYYNRVPTGQLKITGAYKFLGLDKAGNPKPSTESLKSPGFFYSPYYRVAGTLPQLQQYTSELQAASGERSLFTGGPDAYAVNIAQDPRNYTASSVSSSGDLRSQFLSEVENASKMGGGTSKMSQDEAAGYIQQLLDLRNTSFKIEKGKAKAKAKAKAKKAPTKKTKRTGVRKTAAKKKTVAKKEIPVAAISPRPMTGMPLAAGLSAMPPASELGRLTLASELGRLTPAAGLGGLTSPPGSPLPPPGSLQ